MFTMLSKITEYAKITITILGEFSREAESIGKKEVDFVVIGLSDYGG